MTEQTLSYEQYLDALPADRRAEVERVWGLVRERVPAGCTEDVGAKLLSFRAGKDMFVALASQKNYISLHLPPLYVFPELKAKFDAAASPKLKCGKGCINFRLAAELPLEVIGEIIGAHDPQAFAEQMQQNRSTASASRKKAQAKD